MLPLAVRFASKLQSIGTLLLTPRVELENCCQGSQPPTESRQEIMLVCQTSICRSPCIPAAASRRIMAFAIFLSSTSYASVSHWQKLNLNLDDKRFWEK